MTSWRAVGIGFLVGLIVATVGLALPIIGQIAGGLVGGFLAGYLAGGGLGSGAWHGLLAGAVGGLLIAVFVFVGTSLLGVTVTEPVNAIVGGAGLSLVVVFLSLLFALDSALAGAIGGTLRG
jgi:uncharacterized MnhB-related membrane protein